MIFTGPPPGFRALMERKYDILQQQADADTTSAGATATNAATAASIAPSTISESLARAGLLGAQATEVPLTGASQRALEQANVRNLDASTAVTAYRPPQRQLEGMIGANLGIDMTPKMRTLSIGDPFRFGFLGDQEGLSMGRTQLGFAKGTAKVPGKGDGTKDTVPAKLAPGEAVLNKAAAQSVGRGLIAALNAAGARKMGLV